MPELRGRSEVSGSAREGSTGRRRHILHVVDTLDTGGKERVAVNLVNALPRDRYRVSLCTTRRGGPLDALLADDVSRLQISRTSRFDPAPVTKLVAFVRAERVDLLHAHGNSLFHARLAALVPPHPAVLWHDHSGRSADARSVLSYRVATVGVAGVISVSNELAEWSRRRLRVRPDRIWYVPNFVARDTVVAPGDPTVEFPGASQTRIVCVANFRLAKDHLTLIAAMEAVTKVYPAAQLLLVGVTVDVDYRKAVEREIAARGLDANVTILGPRRDVTAILRASAIGVLSSSSEGLPLALIEYGQGGVAAVATDVGECAAVLDHGRAGLVVPPRDPEALGSALLSLLASGDLRSTLSARLKEHVERHFGQTEGVRRVCEVYDHVFGAE